MKLSHTIDTHCRLFLLLIVTDADAGEIIPPVFKRLRWHLEWIQPLVDWQDHSLASWHHLKKMPYKIHIL